MFKILASGAILALVACTLLVQGAESNIQEVLEQRYEELTPRVEESGSLPVVASKEPNTEVVTADELEPSQEATTAQCKCQQADGVPTRVEPQPAKVVKKPKQDKMQTCKLESASSEEIGEAMAEQGSLPQPCVNSQQVAEVEEQQEVQEQKAPEEEVVTKEPVEKSAKKEKTKNKDKKRNKRDTKGGKNKNSTSNKSKSKRSSEGKNKGKNKKSRK